MHKIRHTFNQYGIGIHDGKIPFDDELFFTLISRSLTELLIGKDSLYIADSTKFAKVLGLKTDLSRLHPLVFKLVKPYIFQTNGKAHFYFPYFSLLMALTSEEIDTVCKHFLPEYKMKMLFTANNQNFASETMHKLTLLIEQFESELSNIDVTPLVDELLDIVHQIQEKD